MQYPDKINYSIRPSKQIERKLIINKLSDLKKYNIHIGSYKYIGFGSFYFIDFIMFHKFLKINEMTTIERGEIPKRIEFNKPFDFIEVKMCPFSDFIPTISKEANKGKNHLIWIDETKCLTNSFLQDISLTASILNPYSILIITVNAEKHSYTNNYIEKDNRKLSDEEINTELSKKFNLEFRNLKIKSEPKNFSHQNLPDVIKKTIDISVNESTGKRNGFVTLKIFDYIYSDNARMLTLGYMIIPEHELENMKNGNIHLEETLEISVPQLTQLEQKWLNQNLNKLKSNSDDLAFELKENDLLNYLKFYNEYPNFSELLF